MRTITPATLAGELAAAAPTLSAEQQHLALSVYRLLADGEPVDRDRLATRTGLAPEHVTERLAALPGVYLDDRERVIGFWGLTIRPMVHELLVDDRVLYAWCAWDTLFLPELERFQRRGSAAVNSEWRFVHATHNLLKLHRHQLATGGT